MDYATQLLLQRGRDAGGIALEIVELYENAVSEELDEKDAEIRSLEVEVERLESRIDAFTEDRDHDIKDAIQDIRAIAHRLADGLHQSLRSNDLPTVNRLKALVEEFRKAYPKEQTINHKQTTP